MAVSRIRELKSVGRGANSDKKQTFNLEAAYDARELSKEAPLELVKDKSGFILSLVGGGKAVTGFIKANELAAIRERSKIAESLLMSYSPTSSGACYTYTFKMGKFKGKTPASLYASKEASLDDLRAQKDYLEKNATGRFKEGNMEGVRAIDDLLSRINDDTFAEANIVSTKKVIHESLTRYYARKESDGYQKGWELNVYCNLGAASPYEVQIINCKVKVESNKIVERKDGDSDSINLTSSEWLDFIEKMVFFDWNYRRSLFADALSYVKENDYKKGQREIPEEVVQEPAKETEEGKEEDVLYVLKNTIPMQSFGSQGNMCMKVTKQDGSEAVLIFSPDAMKNSPRFEEFKAKTDQSNISFKCYCKAAVDKKGVERLTYVKGF